MNSLQMENFQDARQWNSEDCFKDLERMSGFICHKKL